MKYLNLNLLLLFIPATSILIKKIQLNKVPEVSRFQEKASPVTSWGWQRGNLRKTPPWVPEVGELAKNQKKTGFNQSQNTTVCQKGHLSEILLWRGEVRRHVTMVAKLLNLNNLSWQRRPFALSSDGRKVWATVLFPSAIMKRKVVLVNFSFFSAKFTGARFVEIQEICYHGNVT